MPGPANTPTDPFDPESALLRLRPRLAAAKARRRRGVAGSALALTAMVGGVASVTLPIADGSGEIAVTAAADGGEMAGFHEALADSLRSSAPQPTSTTTPEPEPAPPADLAPVVPQHTPEPPPPAPKPTPPPPAPKPTPPPPAPKPTPPPVDPAAPVLHTVHYEGTGSIVVEQRGNSVSHVSTSTEPGWDWKPHHGSDYVKVEFRQGEVRRWLKVKVHDGVLKVERWEDAPKCTPTPTTADYAAPEAAGQVTVSLTAEGKLQIGPMTGAEGWNPWIYRQEPTSIKVKFQKEDGRYVWVEVKVHDCQMKMSTGRSW